MTDQTQTDKALMEQTAKNFETVNSELQSTLSTIKGKVTALQAGWVGRGGTSFQNVMGTWSRDQARINDLLGQTAGLIRSAGQSYTAIDDSTASRFNNQSGGNTNLAL